MGLKRHSPSVGVQQEDAGRQRLPACHNRFPGAKLCSWIRQAQCLTINCPEICCCRSTQQEISVAVMSGQSMLQLIGEGSNPAIVRATSCRGGGGEYIPDNGMGTCHGDTHLSSHFICTQPGLRRNDQGWNHFSTVCRLEHSTSSHKCSTCSLRQRGRGLLLSSSQGKNLIPLG